MHYSGVATGFLPDAMLFLTCQANLARKLIENPTRNRRRKTMTPGFYCQWLECEQKNPIASRPPPDKSPSASQATWTNGAIRSGPDVRSLMIDPEALDQVVNLLMPQDFYREAHRLAYEAMVQLVTREA